ncbi:hypothetical protein GP5015_1593 [gamma proteobacterium HTCC5015]|nr:hypothetical protein GP5015_1593 [gamma proteobacterium HTCC5015]
MNLSCFLVIQGKKPKYGPNKEHQRVAGNVKVTKTKPSVSSDEIALKLNLVVPDSLYYKPTLEATIAVPNEVEHGPVITTEVADNIGQIVREQTGITLEISGGGSE